MPAEKCPTWDIDRFEICILGDKDVGRERRSMGNRLFGTFIVEVGVP